jgi:hypothetical protein
MLQFTLRDQVDLSSREGFMKWLLILVIIIAGTNFCRCSEENSSSDNNPSAAINNELLGVWECVRIDYVDAVFDNGIEIARAEETELVDRWYRLFGETSVSDHQLVITRSSVEDEWIPVDSCYERESTPYTFTENALKGDSWEGISCCMAINRLGTSAESCTTHYRTEYSLVGDTLKIGDIENERCSDGIIMDDISYFFFVKYEGTLPPPDWPDECE